MTRSFSLLAGGVALCLSLLGMPWTETADPPVTVAKGGVGHALWAVADTVQPPVRSGATEFGAPVRFLNTEEYTAWPYDNLHWDADREKLFMVYTTGDDHFGANKSVEFQEIDPDTLAPVGSPVIVSLESKVPTPEGATCHASAVLPNGDYLAVIRYTDASNAVTRHEIRRSTDGGVVWANEGMPQRTAVEGGGDINLAAEVGPHGLFVTSAGSLLMGWFAADSEVIYYYRSTDNGQTWALVTTANLSFPDSTPLEPAFFQHPGPGPRTGEILAWHRAGLSGSQVQPIYHTSVDDGQSWSVPERAPRHFDQYNNPAAIVYHPEDDLVEMFAGSRSNPLGTIAQVVATPDDALAGSWGGQNVLFGGAATKNFGYPAVARRTLPDGVEVFVAWYDGISTDTDLWIAKGFRAAPYPWESLPPWFILSALIAFIFGIGLLAKRLGSRRSVS